MMIRASLSPPSESDANLLCARLGEFLHLVGSRFFSKYGRQGYVIFLVYLFRGGFFFLQKETASRAVIANPREPKQPC